MRWFQAKFIKGKCVKMVQTFLTYTWARRGQNTAPATKMALQCDPSFLGFPLFPFSIPFFLPYFLPSSLPAELSFLDFYDFTLILLLTPNLSCSSLSDLIRPIPPWPPDRSRAHNVKLQPTDPPLQTTRSHWQWWKKSDLPKPINVPESNLAEWWAKTQRSPYGAEMGIPNFETLPYNPKFHIPIVGPAPELKQSVYSMRGAGRDKPSDDQIHPSAEEVAKCLKDQSTPKIPQQKILSGRDCNPPPQKSTKLNNGHYITNPNNALLFSGNPSKLWICIV